MKLLFHQATGVDIGHKWKKKLFQWVTCPVCRQACWKMITVVDCTGVSTAPCKTCVTALISGEPLPQYNYDYLFCDIGGYVMRVFAHDHKHYGATRMLEHRYQMELKLGRGLVVGETVHHINGNRRDNRWENLELWTKPQPKGIRNRDAIIEEFKRMDKRTQSELLRLLETARRR